MIKYLSVTDQAGRVSFDLRVIHFTFQNRTKNVKCNVSLLFTQLIVFKLETYSLNLAFKCSCN